MPKRAAISATGISAVLSRARMVLISLGESLEGRPPLRPLARPDSGLKALASLCLQSSGITDGVLRDLARPNSGLRGLTALDLGPHAGDGRGRERARPLGHRAQGHQVVESSRNESDGRGAGGTCPPEQWPKPRSTPSLRPAILRVRLPLVLR